MNFKKKRLNKALEDKIYRVKLVHSKKGWLAVGLTFITLFSATMLSQKTVDASAVNNVAIANSTTSSSVQLWNNVTNNEIHKANRGLANGTAWKTAKAVKGVDGETYLLVGVNEYADAKQMDLSDETSSQNLTGVLRTSSSKSIIRLYTNPLAENGAQLITNRGLAKNTDWKTDIKVVANGETYYRVATNEWVKASDAYLVGESSRSNKAYTKNAPDENTNSNSNSSNNNGGSTPEPVQQSTITTKYVDEDGNEVADAKTEKANKGEKYTANSITVDGYTLDGESSQTIDSVSGDATLTFKYTKDSEPVE